MADRLTPEQRSALMRRIKPAGTTLELWARAVVAAAWGPDLVFNDRSLPGSPDVAVHALKVAVFADGCFWHLCRRCVAAGRVRIPPHARWISKLEANRRRDRRVRERLWRMGWRTVTLMEHEMGDAGIVEKLQGRLRGAKTNRGGQNV
ncbi:MAG TPA: very short patch repair endonuclease [bacterium]|nr:very short patch repair endonuclease [bacterium]